MPVLPHGPYLGLGLWNSVPATLAVELSLFAAGLAAYVTGRRPRCAPRFFWLFVAFLLLIYFAAASARRRRTCEAVPSPVFWALGLWADRTIIIPGSDH